MYHSKISGLGFYVPDNVVTNQDLSQIMDTNDEWIRERTGIGERRHIVKGEDTTTSMGVKAARIAMERADVGASDIDFVIFATLSPDYYFPGPGVLVHGGRSRVDHQVQEHGEESLGAQILRDQGVAQDDLGEGRT